jgi:hypothetical protein
MRRSGGEKIREVEQDEKIRSGREQEGCVSL